MRIHLPGFRRRLEPSQGLLEVSPYKTITQIVHLSQFILCFHLVMFRLRCSPKQIRSFLIIRFLLSISVFIELAQMVASVRII